MKTLTTTPSRQPGCDSGDLEPRTSTLCGHSEVEHEVVACWHEGAREIERCACTRFHLFEDKED